MKLAGAEPRTATVGPGAKDRATLECDFIAVTLPVKGSPHRRPPWNSNLY